MSSLSGISTARVSLLAQTGVATSNIDADQQQLLVLETELSTGKKINSPSDDPGGAAIVQQLQGTLQTRQTYSTNLSQASSQLGDVDSTLGNLTDLIQQAQSTASANVSSDVTASQRTGAAAIVDSIYSQLLTVGNTELSGQYLFAGDKDDTAPFVNNNGTVEYVGSTTLLTNQYDEDTNLSFQVNGNAVFGSLATQVTGTADLTPSLSTATRLIDVNGALGKGVSLGVIQISNGTTTANVDLSHADTISDVIDTINAAAVGGITASVGTNGGLTLTGAAGDDITVTSATGGTTAEDLGIATITGGGAGVPVVGTSIGPKVTTLTPLTDLKNGAGIDLSSGITIANGSQSATVKFSSPPLRVGATVEDALNAINSSGTGVRAQIDASGKGIDILNSTQGTSLSISENGGTTAADLGVRSFSPSTELSTLNGGNGVRSNETGNDLQITDSAGVSFQVKVGGLQTMQDVIDAINTAATTAGAGVTAGFATTGNGLTLTDSAAGSGKIAVTAVDYSDSVTDLGLTTAASGNVITGTDVNPISANGVFGDVAKLRDALNSNDQAGITAAATALQNDYDRVSRVRGQNGAKLQELTSRQSQLDDQNVATQSLLSSVQDTDFASTITQYQQLQTSLQASLLAASKSIQESLLNFLS